MSERDAIAIVGLSCRLPGAPDPDALWRLLRAGERAIGPYPADRFGDDETVRRLPPGGFLADIAGFDAALFGVSPREAAFLDPQQRLALELAWESLEDAGIDPSRLAGSAGVFLGLTTDDYADLLAGAGDAVGRHEFTGLARGLAANRISHTFGLDGPSLVVDTGQSSSLVAVHLACESVLRGESALALAGGVSLISTLRSTLRLEAFGALSPDGHAYVFDERANGMVRGEGGGFVVLKRLADAVAAGDRIHAVIRGSAMGSGTGATGLTAPSAEAQQKILAAALDRAAAAPGDVGYVELHGTGTPAGDPVEAAALGGAYASTPLAVGSIKTNIGHLEAAAGIAGLLKTVLQLRHRELVAGRDFVTPNPAIEMDALGLRVVTEREPWPPGAGALAGVTSIGVGGASCHMVLGPAPEAVVSGSADTGDGPLAWILSAGSATALQEQARRLAAHVTEHALPAADVAVTLAGSRARLPHRAVAVGDTAGELVAALGSLTPGPVATEGGRVAFVFPGQGSQWPGMATALWDTSPVFAESMDACDAAMAGYLDRSLRDIIGDPDALARLELVQPALFAVAVSLAALWKAHGVTPDFVVGHSQGEVAAAYVAGALTLEDAMRVAVLRSRALTELVGHGGIVSLLLSPADAEARIAPWEGRISLAARNGPRSVVVAGDADALEELLAACAADDVRASLIPAGVASHSPAVERVRDRLLEDLAPLQPRSATGAQFCSAHTGELLDGAQLDADYWYRSLRGMVRFDLATQTLLGEGVTAFVESSSHPVLLPAIEHTIEDTGGEQDAAVLPSLRRDDGGRDRFLKSLGAAWAHGIDVEWDVVLADRGGSRVDLPTYPFQRRHYWIEAGAGHAAAIAAVPVAATSPEPASGESAPAPAPDRRGMLAVVREEAAAVAGLADPGEIGERQTFKQLGFDSLAGVELRNRLAARLGVRVPSTLVFDHPTPAAVTTWLLDNVAAAEPAEFEAPAAAPLQASAAPATDGDPIAIVGIGCRYPGDIRSPDELWQFVAQGRDAIGPFPDDRGWDLAHLYDPDPDHRGTATTRVGGFLRDADQFDAAFFGISPREALAMDPQQRVLLETAWEALEHAGIDPQSVRGSDTGVYAGMSTQDYGSFDAGTGDELEGLRLTGALGSVLSGRVSYALGLEGPAMTVDTACSSSLVTLHLAVRALRAGECSLALAGGVTVLATPGVFVEFSRQRGLAADGRCKAFAASADGTGWAEGAGMLVLERLSDARRNGHRVLALVRGTAINQDGASNGLTAPNGPSQERVIRAALADAGVQPGDVDAVEAHGTGTMLGDPIEAQSLLHTYGAAPRDRPLLLGTIKSNLGHSQAAAGVAGVIKMVMALRAWELPRTLHVDAPTPHVDWAAGAVELLTEATPWPVGERRRLAGVSSFGISGTNAHVVLEEAPLEADHIRAAGEADPARPLAWVLGAHDEEALRAEARRLADRVAARQPEPADVAWTLMTARAALPRRAAVVGSTTEEFAAGLEAIAAGRTANAVAEGRAAQDPRVALVFPGQGSQWTRMGLELWDASPEFAGAMDTYSRALAEFTDWDLREALADAGMLERVDVVQPALFAVMSSLALLWQAHGVRPDVVVGHSQGEIVAAHIAGALSFSDAARVVALRSQALAELSGNGGMLALSMTADDAAARIAPFDGVGIAAYNGPHSIVVSGDPESLDAIEKDCREAGIQAHRLPVDYASHSAQVEAIRDRLLADLAPINPVASSIPIMSTATGALIDGASLDAAHWYQSLRDPVRFEQATRALIGDGVTTFIEASPHPVLLWSIDETTEAAGKRGRVARVESLRRDDGGLSRFTRSLAEAHVYGVGVDWAPALRGHAPQLVDLPTYPFAPTRYWRTPEPRGGSAGTASSHEPLLGASVALVDRDAFVASGRLSLTRQPWLSDHRVAGVTLLPGTAFAELALRAGAGAGAPRIAELVLEAPLAIGDGDTEMQVSVGEPGADGRRGVEIHARAEGAEWTRHASGTLAAVAPAPAVADWAVDWPGEDAIPVDLDELRDALAARGLDYGPAFSGLQAVWRAGDSLLAQVTSDGDVSGHLIHPALLDAALHPAFALSDDEALRLPFAWRGLSVHRAGAAALRVRLTPAGTDTVSVEAAAPDGTVVLEADGLVAQRAGALAAGVTGALWQVEWQSARVTSDGADEGVLDWAPSDLAATLVLLQEWIADESNRRRTLVLLTRAAVAAQAGDIPDPDAAAVWGLVRGARAEHPGRFVLVDVAPDAPEPDEAFVAAVLATGEPELALRGERMLVPRLVPASAPPAGAWHLGVTKAGSLSGVAPVRGEGDRALAGGEVRIAVRAAGVNFRDVLIALGSYPGDAPLGSEAAGVVVEVGAGVSELRPGDEVLGFAGDAFGPLAVTDQRLVVPKPGGWSFAEAAAVPVVHATARCALVDVAGLTAGGRVLVHSAAGGVGLAAVALARQLGAEVYATASPDKWDVLRSLGIDDAHLASSRDAGFAEAFGAATGSEGVDVVLSALAGDLVDASFGLLPRGGHFLEIGKADIRDAATVAEQHPGVRYTAIDLYDAGPDRMGELLRESVAKLVAGELAPAPVTALAMGDRQDALRTLREGRNTGKIVLTLPRPMDPDGTVLITGGTGRLGGLVAMHLATAHGARHILLAGRQGEAAQGARELAGSLAAAGCTATFAACDVGDPEAVAAMLAAVDPAHPLTAVFHAAGALADATLASLDAAALDAVAAAKVGGARRLAELTAGDDLAAFVLFSSVAGTLGTAGQANYGAANASLDALASVLRAQGRAATSIAWGLWAQASGMTGDMREEDVARLRRAGLRPLASEQGLALLDAALAADEATLVATQLDRAALRVLAGDGVLPRVFSGLVGTPAAAAREQRAADRATHSPESMLALVREQVAAALGHASADAIAPDRGFREIGFDSLAAVELRNRLERATGLELPTTIVFESGTPAAMAETMLALSGDPATPPPAPAPAVAPAVPAVPEADLGDLVEAAGARAAKLSAPPAARGAVTRAADTVRGAGFRWWVARTRLQLARQGCTLNIQTAGSVRFDGPPRVVISTTGGAHGSLTLKIGHGCRFGRDVTFDLNTNVDGVIEIGDRVAFQNRVRLQPWGGAIRVGAGSQVRDAAELKSRGELVTGTGVLLARNVTIHCHERIELDDGVGLAEGVTVMDSDHTHDGSSTDFLAQPVVATPVHIGANVMVATNAIVMRGARIGPNAVVATSAVVTAGDHPGGHMLAGIPAQAVRRLAPDSRQEQLRARTS